VPKLGFLCFLPSRNPNFFQGQLALLSGLQAVRKFQKGGCSWSAMRPQLSGLRTTVKPENLKSYWPCPAGPARTPDWTVTQTGPWLARSEPIPTGTANVPPAAAGLTTACPSSESSLRLQRATVKSTCRHSNLNQSLSLSNWSKRRDSMRTEKITCCSPVACISPVMSPRPAPPQPTSRILKHVAEAIKTA